MHDVVQQYKLSFSHFVATYNIGTETTVCIYMYIELSFNIDIKTNIQS